MRHDYKAKTTWKLDDSDYPDYQPEENKLKMRKGPKLYVISALIVIILVIAGIIAVKKSHNSQQQAAPVKAKVVKPTTVTIPLAVPTQTTTSTESKNVN